MFASANGRAGPAELRSRTFEPTTTALAINHQGQFPVVTLSFNLAPGVSLGDAVKAIKDTNAQIGLPASIQANFQGTAQAFQIFTVE